MHKPSTNRVILASIPINRKVKRYWVSKYERIVTNCGRTEAERKFKILRQAILSYLADDHRRANLDKYLASTGFRTNGMLRKLFEQAECQPHFVLSFLKLYTAPGETEQSVDSAAGELKERLEQVCANEVTPKFLRLWLDFVFCRHNRSYRQAVRDINCPFHKLALNLGSYDRWHEYWLKWFRILRAGWQSSQQLDYKLPFPEVYKDYAKEIQLHSVSYEQDFADWVSMHMAWGCPLSGEDLSFVDGFLNEDVRARLNDALAGDTEGLEDLFLNTTWASGLYVGHAQHIPKKGSGVVFRDIAVPNRIIQLALVPGADRLYNLVRALPRDATFNQDRFDARIQNRVNNPNLYQGSVDLSKATDNLPFKWGDEIISRLEEEFPWGGDAEYRRYLYNCCAPLSAFTEIEQRRDMVKKSLSLFRTVARAAWEDEGYFVSWKVGQPLGSLPSFAWLSITHNLLVESLSASMGYSHSPYVILGDDIVLMNKKLRKRYIRELTSRGVPLSLHKSFDGRLSEFAGKTYVKGSTPFYCSDHLAITWPALFDWQRSTGIRIPWNNLPRNIRAHICDLTREILGMVEEHPSRNQVISMARSSYEFAQSCEVQGRGSHLYTEWYSAGIADRIGWYLSELEREPKDLPDPVKHTGITFIGNGHPIILLDSRFADKDGYFQRFRPVQLPEWYRDKFRPSATDTVLKAALAALLRISL